jgi:hypothetical protein
MSISLRDVASRPELVDGLLDAMAQTLADICSLKNDELVGNKTFIKELQEGILYFPDREKLNLIESLLESYQYCLAVDAFLTNLCAESQQPYVSMQMFAQSSLYFQGRFFSRPRGEQIAQFQIGGFGGTLVNELKRDVAKWLHGCDAVMSRHFGDRPSSSLDAYCPVERVANVLAARIARHITYMAPQNAPQTHLTARFLENVAADEYARCAEHAENTRLTDLTALKALLALVRGGTVDEFSLLRQSHLLAHIVESPPHELHITRANTPKFNFQLLRRACAAGDASIKTNVFNIWRGMHGAHVAAATAQAIDQLEQWRVADQRPYIQLLAADGTALPRPTFMWADAMHLVSRHGRTGLDGIGLRIVRLTSLVWTLLASNLLPTNAAIASHIIHPAATHALCETRLVAGLLLQNRDRLFPGQRLLKFTEDLTNSQSHLDDAVASALCNLSRFSMMEIFAVFHPDSPLFVQLVGELAVRTREASVARIPSGYGEFANDALAVVVPIVMQRRARLGIRFGQPSNAIVDLLRTIEKVRSWSPLHGTLSLTKKDLKKASPLTQHLLEEFDRRGLLCTYKRRYNRETKSYASAHAFVFDTVLLNNLLRRMTVSRANN